jgi:hypothetical protein
MSNKFEADVTNLTKELCPEAIISGHTELVLGGKNVKFSLLVTKV